MAAATTIGVLAPVPGISNMASGFAKMCRTCAACTECLMPIFSGEGLLNNLAEKIHRHLPIRVSERDRLPQQLCRQCASTLLAWHELVKCCTQADAALRVRLQRLQERAHQEKEASVKHEMAPAAVQPTPIKEQGPTSEQEHKLYDRDIPWRSDSDSDSDTPLANLASDISHEQVRRFCDALAALHAHVKWRHPRGSPTEESSSEEEQELLPPVADDTLKNKRRDTLDDATRAELSAARVTVEGRVMFRCAQCGRELRSAHTYVQHRRIHTGERPCVCHVCGKSFRAAAGLQRHVRDTHLRRKPHACTLCRKTFANRQTLALHMRTHTGERPYVCAQCGRRFTQSASLGVHVRTHTGEAPHACAECGACFRQRSALTHHALGHTGERPHECGECGRAYRTRHQLNTHARAHDMRRPHACALCRRGFSQRRALRNHLRRAHPEYAPPQRFLSEDDEKNEKGKNLIN